MRERARCSCIIAVYCQRKARILHCITRTSLRCVIIIYHHESLGRKFVSNSYSIIVIILIAVDQRAAAVGPDNRIQTWTSVRWAVCVAANLYSNKLKGRKRDDLCEVTVHRSNSNCTDKWRKNKKMCTREIRLPDYYIMYTAIVSKGYNSLD